MEVTPLWEDKASQVFTYLYFLIPGVDISSGLADFDSNIWMERMQFVKISQVKTS